MNPPEFYVLRCLKQKVYATEFWDSDDLINGTEVAAPGTVNVPRWLDSLVGSIGLLCEAYLQEEDWTLRTSVVQRAD
jgi:hypothetical protein